MTVRKVAKGQVFRPRASDWNAFASAANAHGMDSAPVANPGAGRTADSADLVWVRNDTGRLLPMFSPVQLGPMLTAPTDPLPQSISWTPAMAANMCFSAVLSSTGRTAVVQQVMSPGQIGRAVASGVTPVYMAWVASNATRRFARFYDGMLQQSEWGEARILWLGPRRDAVAGGMAVVAIGPGSEYEPMVSAAFDGATLQLRRPDGGMAEFSVTPGSEATTIIVYYRDDVYYGQYSLMYMDTSRVSGPNIGHLLDLGMCQIYGGGSPFRDYGETRIDYALRVNPPHTDIDWLVRPSRLPHKQTPNQLQWNPYSHTVTWVSAGPYPANLYVPPDTRYTLGLGGRWGERPDISYDQSYLQSLDWYEWGIGTVGTGLDGRINVWSHDDLPPAYAMVRNKPGS